MYNYIEFKLIMQAKENLLHQNKRYSVSDQACSSYKRVFSKVFFHLKYLFSY